MSYWRRTLRPPKAGPARTHGHSPSELGCFPVMNLFAAGVKVGQTMARARLGGHGLRESVKWRCKTARPWIWKENGHGLNKEENGLLRS